MDKQYRNQVIPLKNKVLPRKQKHRKRDVNEGSEQKNSR